MLQKVIQACIVCASLFVTTVSASFANDDVLVVSSSANKAIHDIAVRISEQLLNQNINSALLDPDKSSLSILKNADLIIALGNRIIETVLEKAGDKPIIGIATSDLPHETNLSLLIIRQPVCRQFSLIRHLSADIKTVSVISHNDSIKAVLEQCARQNRLTLRLAVKRDHESLASAVSKALESDAILALPDKSIYNANTVKNILLRSYRKRIPVIGFSRAFVNAGALAALHSDPDQIARQVVASVKQYFATGELPAPLMYPDYYDVLINHRVSDALELDLPPEQVILERMKADIRK